MPTAILNPNAESPFTAGTWAVTGAATIWQALADDLPSSYAHDNVAGFPFAVLFESLPGTADTIVSVTLKVNIGSDTGPGGTVYMQVTDADGAYSISDPFVVPDGGSSTYEYSPAIPPGEFDPEWTPALVNVLSGGLAIAEEGTGTDGVEKMWLEVVYTEAGAIEDTGALPVKIVGAMPTARVNGTRASQKIAGSSPASRVSGSAPSKNLVGSAPVAPIRGRA